jgi:hypothetical protein
MLGPVAVDGSSYPYRIAPIHECYGPAARFYLILLNDRSLAEAVEKLSKKAFLGKISEHCQFGGPQSYLFCWSRIFVSFRKVLNSDP